MFHLNSILQFCYIFSLANNEDRPTSVSDSDDAFIPTGELTLGTCLSAEVKNGAAIYDWLLTKTNNT